MAIICPTFSRRFAFGYRHHHSVCNVGAPYSQDLIFRNILTRIV